MSMKERGKSLGKKVVRGSETVGRDVKKGMSRVAKGARTVGRDVEKGGKRMGRATRSGMTRADARIRPNHKPRSRSD
jgi:hypothetical protein